MISLLFKILADASPWRKTVNEELPKDAKKAGKDAGSAAGKEFGAQMKSAVMSYLGAGAILGALRTQATKATEILRDAQQSGLDPQGFQELTKASEETGKSIEELQRLARELPKDFDAMMKGIRERGGFFTQEDLESLREVKNAMDEASNSAGKLFAYIWNGSKAIASMAANGAMAGAGAVASTLGSVTGSERLSEAGRFLTTTADIGAEQINAGTPRPRDRTATSRFMDRARMVDEGNRWWDSVGGNQDWSAQSESVRSREAERLLREQTRLQEQTNRNLERLNATVGQRL